MTDAVDAREFLHGFLAEADENLARITGTLAAIEREPQRVHARELGELFRALHTLKGLAGMMSVEPIVAIAHAMETRVRDVQRAGVRLPISALDPLVAGAQAIASRVQAVARGVDVPAPPDGLLVALARRDDAGEVVPASTSPTLMLDPALREKLVAHELAELDEAHAAGEQVICLRFAPSPEKAARGESIPMVRAAVERLGRIVRVLPRAVPRDDRAPGGLEFVLLLLTRASVDTLAEATHVDRADIDVIGANVAAAPEAEPTPVADAPVDDALDRATRKGLVRVDVARLDVAVELLAAVGNGRTRLRRQIAALAESGVDVRALISAVDDEARVLRRLRTQIMGLRMVGLHEVLEPLPLILRGLRGATGKDVRLELDVGDIELDKTVGERILPALIHLVRNAVDHGIEAGATRRARGKPEQGTVVVRASTSGSATLELVIADDGGGIDVAAVAKRTGLPATTDDAELLDRITAPGFSTRDAVSTTSGRGLGLDIVRRTIEGIGGTLELHNRVGHGTTWRLRAPLSVALVDAFACEAAEQRYLVPVGAVESIVDLDDATLVDPAPADRRGRAVGLLAVRGAMVPLVSLRDVLGVPAIAAPRKAMLVQIAAQTYAFGVDRMLGRHEVVVRPLADPLVQVDGVAGSADLGDGRPTLLLDLRALGGRLARGARTEVHA